MSLPYVVKIVTTTQPYEKKETLNPYISTPLPYSNNEDHSKFMEYIYQYLSKNPGKRLHIGSDIDCSKGFTLYVDPESKILYMETKDGEAQVTRTEYKTKSCCPSNCAWSCWECCLMDGLSVL